MKAKLLLEGGEIHSAERFASGGLLAHTRIDRTQLGGVTYLHHVIVAAILVENSFTVLFVIIHRSMKAVIGKEKVNVRFLNRSLNTSVIL